MSSGSRKVLISGPVEGKLSALFKRVEAVNAKSGPFDLLLCIGPFFSDANNPESDQQAADPELDDYISGKAQVPLHTYFIGGWGSGSAAALAALQDGGPEGRLHYLGRSGVRDVEGLLVAYLDGRFGGGQAYREGGGEEGGPAPCRHYNQADVSRLKDELQHTPGDIDFLLTNEWPEGATSGVPKEALPHGINTSGSRVAREVAMVARPRYHVAGGKGLFWARVPYVNKDLGAGPLATRFIGLAGVGALNKQKWLHALGVVPASKMDAVQLVALPEGSTPSPYEALEAMRLNKRSAPSSGAADEEFTQDWRWRQQRKGGRGPAGGPGGAGGANKKFKGEPQVDDSGLRNREVVVDNRRSVLVRNIPFQAQDADLAAFFEGAGKVVDIRRGRGQDGKPRGHGYVQLDSEEAVERALLLSGTELMGRTVEIKGADQAAEDGGKRGQPVDTCWFCLSNEGADVELVASVGEECYLAMDKGAIHETHALLLPIEHYPASVGLPRSTWAEVQRYLSALRSAFAAQGRELIAFERHVSLKKIGGNHCHINVAGITRQAAKTAREVVESKAMEAGMEMQYVAPCPGEGEALRDRLRAVVGDGEYLSVLLPDGGWLLRPILRGERHNLNFGREVLAQLLGAPERADWKNCVVGSQEEQDRTARFKEMFAEFDIMQQQEQG